jgi:hypothetical protein
VRNVSQEKIEKGSLEFLNFIGVLQNYINENKIDRYETTVSQLMDMLFKDAGIPF